MNAALAAEISRLTSAEKLQLAGELWDQFAVDEERLSVPQSHEKILAEDKAAYQANPLEGSPWAEVKTRLSGKS